MEHFVAWMYLVAGIAIRNSVATSLSIAEMEEEPILVEGVEGGNVKLPCDAYPTSDQEEKINLILWYKDDGQDPIYSYDARHTVFPIDRHYLKETSLKDRVSFAPSTGVPVPHKLILSKLLQVDEALYTCRVDFTMAQSITKKVRLKVITPVDSLTIYDSFGQQAPSVLAAVPEGAAFNITCTARGGRPTPTVTWWMEDGMIDDSWSETAKGLITNTLILNPLTRAHAHAILKCKATPSPIAVETETVQIDMYLKPESVTISLGGTRGTVRAGDFVDLTCTTRGSRPPPDITWYKGNEKMSDDRSSTKALMGVTAVSHARFKIYKDDNGIKIMCRVTNHKLPQHTMQEYVTLNVTYIPEVDLRMGSTLQGSVVKEKTDVYLTCHIDANPAVTAIAFFHKGSPVKQDRSGGVVITGHDLVLRDIQRSQGGSYNCKATNDQGMGSSPSVNITVLYAPICTESSDIYAEPGSQITASCGVSSSPAEEIRFSWVWLTPSYTRRIMPSQIISNGLKSNVSFIIPNDNASISEMTPKHQLGILQCWARNKVGKQASPCSSHVRRPVACKEKGMFGSSSCTDTKLKKNSDEIPVPPSSPVNCTLANVGRKHIRVTCQPGDSGSMSQTYQLQIYEARTQRLHINVSSPTPSFIVPNLTAGRDYTVYVSSHTAFGGSPFKLVEAFNLKTAENRMRDGEAEEISWFYIIIFVSCTGGLILLILIIIAVIRLRMRRSQLKCTVRNNPGPIEPKLADKNLYLDSPQENLGSDYMEKNYSATEAPVGSSDPYSLQKPKETITPAPIIRQNSGRLQPIIKENGRAEPVRSSQQRTVLFVEPLKTRSTSLSYKDECSRNYDNMLPTGRRTSSLSSKEPIGDARTAHFSQAHSYEDNVPLYSDRGSKYHFSNEKTLGNEMYDSRFSPLPTNPVYRDSDYYSTRNSNISSKNVLYRSSTLPTAPTDTTQPREHSGSFSYSSHRRENVYDPVPLSRVSPPTRPSIMKKSPSMSGSVYHRGESTRADGQPNTYRSLPRPNKSRRDDFMLKYQSLDRRFDIPFTGSLPRPENKDELREGRRDSFDSKSDIRNDVAMNSRTNTAFRPYRDSSFPQKRTTNSGRLRFSDEKLFHVYSDKDRRQNVVDDSDENFV